MSTNGLHTSGLAAVGQSLRLDTAANNLANVSTPAFRRDRLSFRERLVEALEDRPDLQYYNSLADRQGGAPFVDSVAFDRRPGGFEVTGRALDFALKSDGWFGVRDRETGRLFHTRAGNFALDAGGRLVTADGRCELVTSDGRALEVDPSSSELRLDAEGRVFQGDAEVGRLAIAAFDDLSRLRKAGDNLFVNAGALETEPSDPGAVQGALETSSVNAVTEMVEMIQALRALETNLQMIRIQDGTLDRAVNDLGRLQK